MMNLKQGFVAANGLNIFYHRTAGNESKPPLVLLHGFSDNGRCWIQVVNEVADQYDVIMPDARGHGRTEGPSTSMAYDLLAQDVIGLIQALGLEQPILFGHSMGALTALVAAAQAPDLVRAIVLEDPPFWNEAQKNAITVAQLEEERAGGLEFRKRPLAEKIVAIREGNPHWAEVEFAPWAESKDEHNPGLLAPNIRLEIRTYDWKTAATKVQCPTLLLTAHPGGIVKPATAREAASLMPNCEVAQIDEAGHCIHRDKFDETMKVVLEFLQRQHAK